MAYVANFLAGAAFLLAASSLQAQTPPPSAEAQIATALLAAPADKREGAAVWGYSQTGDLVLLRKGTNELVCLADDPEQQGLSVSCYHQDLDAFMARGRALKKAGMSFQEIFDTREQEVKSGKLPMPKQPTTLFVFTATKEQVMASGQQAPEGYLRYVVYIPWATAESTGLPLKPEGPAMPWIMYPGTHAAHIMINPPQE